MNKQNINIVADENIPLLDEFFAPIANITRADGRVLRSQDVQGADALVLRSTTQVNAQLIGNSPTQFVGTCTIGIDHLDTDYLDQRGIAWTNAPGCNTESVCDYAVSAINHAWHVHGLDPRTLTIGVVGAGDVGGRLIQRLRNAGLEVICCDPPQQATQQAPHFVSLEELMQQARIICLHTPLTTTGVHATVGMINEELIASIPAGSMIISAGRGEVVDQPALLSRVREQRDLFVYFDVWQNEPQVNLDILPYCQIATPHIAGHSLEGKVRGTEMIYQALCQHFDLPLAQSLANLMPKPAVSRLVVDESAGLSDILNAACNSVYPLSQDDARFRMSLQNPQHTIAHAFDSLRKDYPVRREFSTLAIEGITNVAQANFMAGLGFSLT